MEVRLALDTNRYTDLCRGTASVVEAVELADEVLLPLSSWANYALDSRWEPEGPKNEAVLRRFLMKPGVGVLYADEQTTHHYAAVYRQLRNRAPPSRSTICGSPPWSCNMRCVLCARDAHFDALPQLPRV